MELQSTGMISDFFASTRWRANWMASVHAGPDHGGDKETDLAGSGNLKRLEDVLPMICGWGVWWRNKVRSEIAAAIGLRSGGVSIVPRFAVQAVRWRRDAHDAAVGHLGLDFYVGFGLVVDAWLSSSFLLPGFISGLFTVRSPWLG